jgi:hypothetical protein
MVNNKDNVAAGFAWQRLESAARDNKWLRDLVLAVAVAVASSLLVMIGEAHSQASLSQPLISMESPPHYSTVVRATASQN